MTGPRTKFYLDKLNAKWSGVCAGIADYTGIDVTVIRIGFVLSLFVPGLAGITIPGYFLTSWLAPRKPVELYKLDGDQKKFWQDVRRSPHRVTRDVRSRFRELDRRLADVETYVTSSNSRLANEIEQLR